jgi:hypothetical protein
MPEMSGIDMMKRLALVSKAKVIVVSSVGQVGSPQAVQRASWRGRHHRQAVRRHEPRSPGQEGPRDRAGVRRALDLDPASSGND